MSPRKQLFIISIIFLLSWLLGTIAIHRVEIGHPLGASYFNSLYFTVITTATIGFGDLVPMTVAGKVITMIYAIFYVPLFLYTMSVLFTWEFHKLSEKKARKLQKNIDQILINQEEILTKEDVGGIIGGEKASKIPNHKDI
mgnify:CR=1